MRKLLSGAFVLGGVFLLYEGASSLWFEYQGQEEAAELFEVEQLAPQSIPHSGPQPLPQSLETAPALCRMSFPRLQAEMYVLPTLTKQSLRRGPGNLMTSALPGQPGNAVIAAHRDTHFRLLKDIQLGDEIWIER